MAVPFVLTERPVRVTAMGFQPLDEALDIGDFDDLDVSLGVLYLEGNANVTIELWSGMQNQTDSGFVQLYAFAAQTAVYNKYLAAKIKSTDGPLRYLRWKVTALTGSSPAATFFIRGMARNFAGDE
jgi:hypothetical protein